MNTRDAIRRMFGVCGLEVRTRRAVQAYERRRKAEDWKRKWAILSAFGDFQTILDVGANTGQFAHMIHDVFPSADIWSFEPLPDCHERLCAAMRGVQGFRAFNMALGDKAMHAILHRTEASPSSSLLTPAERLIREYPHTASIQDVRVSVERMDDVLRTEASRLRSPILVKLDVQGYEPQVLEGAVETLARAEVVVAEVCFVRQYEGQGLFDCVYERLRAAGFRYAGQIDQTVSPLDSRILEADAVFVRGRTA